MNSPTKLPIPGKPREARAKNIDAPPRRGATDQRPPIRLKERVWSRSWSAPASMKSAPVLSPWETIWIMAPLEGETAACKKPEEHKTHVADARIRDEALHVVLRKGKEGAVEHPDNAEHHEGHGQRLCLCREERDCETEQPVGACLEQEAGEDDAARGRGLRVRVRQPGVERHGGELHQEGGEEPEQQEERDRGSDVRMEQGLIVEGIDARGAAMCEIEADNGREHEKAARLRKEKELDRGPEAVFMAPQVDEKIHGHEHELPGKIEEEEVEAEEDAEHTRDGPGEAQVKKARPLLDLVPGGGTRHAA